MTLKRTKQKTTATPTTKKTKFPSEPVWTFGGQLVESEQIQDYAGFVYRITDRRTGQFYIGKKVFFTDRVRTYKTGRKRRRLRKESDWRRYWSSCEPLKAQVLADGAEHFTREILCLCPSKRMMSYFETKLQFSLNALEREDCLNVNIAGKFFKFKQEELDNVLKSVDC